MAAVVAVTSAQRQPRTRWIHGFATDSVLAFCWVPFGVAAVLWTGNVSVTRSLMSGALILSFTHQPLTLPLVYGDREQFELRRRIFMWSPIVFTVAVYVTLNVSLTLLAIVGGLWNAIHTLFQRYGYEEEAEIVQDLYLAGKKDEAAAAIPDEFLAATNLVGTEGFIKDRLAAFADAGVTSLTLHPVGEDPLAVVSQIKEWAN